MCCNRAASCRSALMNGASAGIKPLADSAR
jgi:hypothetical protein